MDYVGYGGESGDLGLLSPLWGPRPDGVLMTSGRALPRKGADWSRASERYKVTVRLMMPARVWTQYKDLPDDKAPIRSGLQK